MKPTGACDVCKRRKVRCAGGDPCPNCVRHDVTCKYTPAGNRLAQSQRRIAQLQDRLQNIERAWKHFLPDVELVQALALLDSQSPETTTTTAPTNPSSPDSEYEEAETLNWDESLATSATDGIGSLSMKWKGIGYMGPQTGNTLLRKLHSLAVLHLGPEEIISQGSPPVSEVPDQILRSTVGKHLDAYFKNIHPLYPILHEGYFRAQHMGVIPKPKDGSWPILYNTVLAMGAFSETNIADVDTIFARRACEPIGWEKLQKGTLQFVQAFVLLAIYLQKRNKPNSSFTLLGIAANMAQGIGLHREFSGSSVNIFQMELRRRVWWTFFIFDSEFRLTFGRPTLQLGGINTKLPRNLNDTDLAVDLEILPESINEPTIVSNLIWQARLARIGNSANEKLVAKHIPSESYMLKLGQDVREWEETLPVYMQMSYAQPLHNALKYTRMVLLWRAMHLRINIFRPFLLASIRDRSPLILTGSSSTASCFHAAEECATSILSFVNVDTMQDRFFLWFTSYWAITAVFVHITCLLYDQQHSLAPTWRQRVQAVRDMLEKIGNVEPTAARAARILDKVMNLAPTTPDSTMDSFNEPMRMEVAELWNRSWPDMLVPQEISPSTWNFDADFIGLEHLLG